MRAELRRLYEAHDQLEAALRGLDGLRGPRAAEVRRWAWRAHDALERWVIRVQARGRRRRAG